MEKSILTRPDYVFALSWEVCNKVGGIYTVLSTQAKTLQTAMPDRIIYFGPYFDTKSAKIDFIKDDSIHPEWKSAADEAGIPIYIGRWKAPGSPIAVLVDSTPLMTHRDIIYSKMWKDFQVDSLHAYGDYHDASMFAYAVGKVCETIAKKCLPAESKVLLQAHEWMSGFALLYVKKHCPEMATVFTTHATSIGRSITSNNKPLYDYFENYFGDQMASELHMEAKHSVEKCAAQNADCMTTVSEVTDAECRQFLERKSDVILPNGFDMSIVPTKSVAARKRKAARLKLFDIAHCLTGKEYPDDTLVVTSSGRNDFRCKGFDVLICALKKLQQRNLAKDVLAIIAVPCWKEGPRKDLESKVNESKTDNENQPLSEPFITHTLYNFNEDRIVNTIKGYGIGMSKEEKLHILFIPSYLDGNDGIVNLKYYDWLTASDLCLYPSYYEPWGYTCLESIAFGIPCLTTDLAGFGVWANSVVSHNSTLKDGVQVIHRSDSNYEEAAGQIADTVETFSALKESEIKAIRTNASQLAKKAQWKDFIQHYYQAFDQAFKNK